MSKAGGGGETAAAAESESAGPAVSGPGSPEKLTISIRTLDGKTTKLEVERSWTIQRVKEEFGKYRGTDFGRVNMHYKGKRLTDDKTVQFYNIESDGFIQANIRSLGRELLIPS